MSSEVTGRAGNEPPEILTLAWLDALLAERMAAEPPLMAGRAEALLRERLVVRRAAGKPPVSVPAEIVARPTPAGRLGSEVTAGLRSRILSGDLPPGAMLPKAAELAARHGVTVRTVIRAAGQLRAEGLIVRLPAAKADGGVRLYVTAPGEEFRLNPFCSIADCGKPRVSRGYCLAHYRRWQRYGDPLGRPGPEPVVEFRCQQCGIIATRQVICCGQVTHILGLAAEEPRAS